MRIEAYTDDGPVELDAQRLIVYDEFDNPIAAVICVEPMRYVAVTATHKQFQQILKAMGVDKPLTVKRLDTAHLQPLL